MPPLLLLLHRPDLYDTDYSSEGLGNWCLMASECASLGWLFYSGSVQYSTSWPKLGPVGLKPYTLILTPDPKRFRYLSVFQVVAGTASTASPARCPVSPVPGARPPRAG